MARRLSLTAPQNEVIAHLRAKYPRLHPDLVFGAEIAVGDAIEFFGRWHRIVSLDPYEGSLLAVLGAGTRIARCDTGLAITIEGGSTWDTTCDVRRAA
jgi:hypothetical protein